MEEQLPQPQQNNQTAEVLQNQQNAPKKKHISMKKLLLTASLFILLGIALLAVLTFFKNSREPETSSERPQTQTESVTTQNPAPTPDPSLNNGEAEEAGESLETNLPVFSKQTPYSNSNLEIKFTYNADLFEELVTSTPVHQTTSSTFVLKKNTIPSFQGFTVFLGENTEKLPFTEWLTRSVTFYAEDMGGLYKATSFSLENKPRFDSGAVGFAPDGIVLGVANIGYDFALIGMNNLFDTETLAQTTLNSLGPTEQSKVFENMESFSFEPPLLMEQFEWFPEPGTDFFSYKRSRGSGGYSTQEISGTMWKANITTESDTSAWEIANEFSKYYNFNLWNTGWTTRKEVNGYTLSKGIGEGVTSSSWGKFGTSGTKFKLIGLSFQIADDSPTNTGLSCPCNVELNVFISNESDTNSL